MIDQETPKYYNTRFKEFMTLSEVQYRKNLAADQVIVVRETSQTSLDQWQRVFAAARSGQ